jgi:hypothetical protein
VNVWPQGRVQALLRFQKDTDIGAAVEEEGDLLGYLVADGITGRRVMRQERDPHGVPP